MEHPVREAVRASIEVAGSDQRDESSLYLLVGEIQQVASGKRIGFLDGEIAALEDHRQWLFHIRFVVDEFLGEVVVLDQLIDVLFEMVQQAY